MTIDDVALRVSASLSAAGVPFILVRATGTRAMLEEIRRTVPKL